MGRLCFIIINMKKLENIFYLFDNKEFYCFNKLNKSKIYCL
ncbi:hypothetical protein HMPREF3180_01697 [Leptotrichia wadei]|uniref:Uncharacterized protein n=2 Tax=Leptotrichia wadei TaxID=157687 RepID=A0A134A3C9_9FUSO|nr:hypothetical protein HMPREF9015_01145 [Leptotrichia wadei F0279]KXB62192.1 hypothetical protein HMPREF3180_01697 [Leptotrichia wadei]